MTLDDINATVFKTLTPEVQQSLIEAQSNDIQSSIPIVMIVALVLWAILS